MSSKISQQQRIHPNSLANLRPFAAGQSGNPGGNYKHTPKFNHTFERLLALSPEERRAYQPQNGVEELALAQINRAIAAEKERDRITATEKVIDRVEGKAQQTINQMNTNYEMRLELSIADVLDAARKLGLEIDVEEAARLIELVAREE